MSQIKQIRPEIADPSVKTMASPDRRVRRTRRQILDATVALMKTRGLGGFTMDAIADAADVSRSTLYRHWPQLHDLLYDALQYVGDEIDAVSTAPGDGGSTEQCVVANALVVGRVVRDDTMRTLIESLAVAAEHNADAAVVYERSAAKCRDAIRDFVRSGQAAGEVPAELDAEWVTDLVVAPIYMNAIVLHRPMTDEQIAAHIVATFNALGAPAPLFREAVRESARNREIP